MADSNSIEWDLLKLHDSFTLVEAACIVINSLPANITKLSATNDEPYGMPSFGSWHTYNNFGDGAWHDDPQGRDAKLETVLKALVKAVRDNKLKSDYVPITQGDLDPWHIEVEVDALKAWLQSKNIRPVFFFGEQNKLPDYLDPTHPRYAAKLAASVKAWLAMEDENLLNGKKPKAAMEDWLSSRYSDLGLTYKGKINNTAIEEAAKVANWETDGGAPATPTS